MNANDVTCPTITVVVNGVPEATCATTLQAWLEIRGALPVAHSTATAINGHFVPRSMREQQLLAEGDSIVTFQPIVGG